MSTLSIILLGIAGFILLIPWFHIIRIARALELIAIELHNAIKLYGLRVGDESPGYKEADGPY